MICFARVGQERSGFAQHGGRRERPNDPIGGNQATFAVSITYNLQLKIYNLKLIT